MIFFFLFLFVVLICTLMVVLAVYFNTARIIILFNFHLIQAKTVFRLDFLRLIITNFNFQDRFADFYLRSIFYFFWFALIPRFIFFSKIIE